MQILLLHWFTPDHCLRVRGWLTSVPSLLLSIIINHSYESFCFISAFITSFLSLCIVYAHACVCACACGMGACVCPEDDLGYFLVILHIRNWGRVSHSALPLSGLISFLALGNSLSLPNHWVRLPHPPWLSDSQLGKQALYLLSHLLNPFYT